MNAQGVAGVLMVIGMIILGVVVFFLPTIIARRKRKANSTAILVVNLLGAVTFGVCWIVALVWALTADARQVAAQQGIARACMRCGTIGLGQFCPSCGEGLTRTTAAQ